MGPSRGHDHQRHHRSCWWRREMGGLPLCVEILGSEFGNDQEPVSLTDHCRDARQAVQRSYFHQVGPLECVPSHSHQLGRWIWDCFLYSVQSVRIPRCDHRLDKPTGDVSVLHRWLFVSLHQWLCHVPPWKIHHRFYRWEEPQSTRTKSSRVTTGIRFLLPGQKLLIRSLGGRLDGVCHQFWESRHGIGLNLDNQRLADPCIGPAYKCASWICEHLLVVHSEICKDHISIDRATKEREDGTCSKGFRGPT